MTPQRIQRKRTKGWKIPENSVSVTRPGKWGNFLKLSDDMIMIDAGHRRKNLDKWVFLCFGDLNSLLEIYQGVLQGYVFEGWGVENETDLKYWMTKALELDLSELKGKNLACFCKEGQPCHAEILLKLANQ